MPGQHRHIVAQREQLFPDPLDQKIDISTGQVAAANASGEKDIAANEQLVLARKKAKAAGTMSRNFQHLHFQAEKLARGRFFNEEVRLNRLDFQLKSEAAKKFWIGNHWRR